NAYPDAHIARQIMAIRTTSALNINFVRYVLLFEMSKLKQKANSMIPGISRQDLLEEILPLPPLEEQIRIVEKLDKFISINL
ncbi:MAG: restriction endonuclease subunit S, partial [Weissella confusa]|nr:restriction endonuclease subunit S [Weissella confusa]